MTEAPAITLPPVDPFPMQSANFGKLPASLAKARGAFETILKGREVTVNTKTGGSYKFKYAELSDIHAATDPALTANGLLHSSSILPIRDRLYLITSLMHESGEWLRSYMPLAGPNDGPQAFGSQITYFKRYAISALLGVSSEDDDDGNAAEGNTIMESQRRPAQGQAVSSDQPQAVFNGEAQLITYQTGVRKNFAAARTVAELEAVAKKGGAELERLFKSPVDLERNAASALVADYNDRLRQLQSAAEPAKTVEDVLAGDHVPY